MSSTERNPLDIRAFRSDDEGSQSIHVFEIPSCFQQPAIMDILQSFVSEGNRKGIIFISAETGRGVSLPFEQLREMTTWDKEDRIHILSQIAEKIQASPSKLLIEQK